MVVELATHNIQLEGSNLVASGNRSRKWPSNILLPKEYFTAKNTLAYRKRGFTKAARSR
jgi:hypothetical protein